MSLKFKINQLKAVIFDFDGTLANSHLLWRTKIDPEIYKKFGLDFNKTAGAFQSQSQGLSINNRAKLFLEMHNLQDKAAINEIMELYAQIYKQSFDKEVQLYDGVIETLEYLKSKNIKMAIGTGCDKSFLDYAVEKLGLNKYMTAVVTCEEVGENKPNPLVFHAAMERCGCSKDQCIVIEDSLPGIQCAKNADSIQPLLMLSSDDNVEKKKSCVDYFFTDYRQLLKDLKATDQ